MPDIFYPLRPFDKKIVEELNNRRLDRPTTDDIYSPKMGWARVTSLAEVTFGSKKDVTKKGFILTSNVGFDEIYGFGQEQQSGILGFSADENRTPHRLSDIGLIDLKRPSPGLTNIDCELQSGEGKFVNTVFKYRCHDQFQFQYLTPFFMTPGVTVCLEWGWAKNIPPSLLPVDNFQELIKFRDNWNLEQQKRLDSSGNYEMVLGMVTGYDFNLQPDGGYECSVEVKSIGYSIYGLANVNETIAIKDDELEVRKKTSKRISDIIETYLSSEGNLRGGNFGFSRDILTKRIPKAKTNISEKDGWISFGKFIELLNREKVFKFNNDGESNAFEINIENSWISANPNIKSTDGSVLLIPNPIAPAWEITGDNVYNANGTQYTEGWNSNFKYKDANDALSKMNKSFQSNPGGYTGDSRIRVDLAAIITGGVDVDIAFPSRDNPYSGHLKNLFIHKELIIESLENSQLTIQGLFDILKKISSAAGNVWDFQIISDPNNKTKVCIVDKNFPGFNETGDPLTIDDLKDKFTNNPEVFYTFSSMDSDSILRGLDFSVKLSDAVGTQVMMDASDSNVSRDDDKFYQTLFTTQDETVEVKIVDKFAKLVAKQNSSEEDQIVQDEDKQKQQSLENGNNPKQKLEAPATIQPLNEEFYYPIELTVDGKTFTVRLVEPNDEIVKSAMGKDNSPLNSVRFNGLVQGITINLTMTGISGIRYFDVFDISNLPYPYNTNAVFQVINIKHSWSNNDWTTTLESMIRPRPSMFLSSNQQSNQTNQ